MATLKRPMDPCITINKTAIVIIVLLPQVVPSAIDIVPGEHRRNTNWLCVGLRIFSRHAIYILLIDLGAFKGDQETSNLK